MGKRLTRAEVADMWGVARQQVDKAIEAGRLSETNATIDADEAEAVRAAMDVDKVQRAEATKELQGAGAEKKPDKTLQTFNLARTQDQVLKAKQRKLAFEIEQGKWVLRDLVLKQSLEAAKMLTLRLDAACKALAPQLCVVTNQQEAHDLLERTLIDSVLADFRRELGVEHDAERADEDAE